MSIEHYINGNITLDSNDNNIHQYFLFVYSKHIYRSIGNSNICVLPNMLLIVIENNFQWNGKVSYVQMSMHILKAVDFAYTEYYFQAYIV